MTIYYFGGDGSEQQYIAERLRGHRISFFKEPIQDLPELKDQETEVLCVFVDSTIGEAELSRFPNVTLIATRSTGFDHIDLAACKARGITVSSVPSYGENTVAEFTFALLLALSRHIIEANAKARSGEFSPEGLRGFDLRGKTLGVIGTGRIGARVIKAAKGFEMQVIAFDAFPNASLAETLGFSYLSFEEVLAQSDILSLHVPYMQETHHLLNKAAFAKVKKGAYFINTARGAVVDTEALLGALEDGTLAGAGLDVLEGEKELGSDSPLAKFDHILIHHPRVLATPHVAFDTNEGVQRILDTTSENIVSFAAGTPKNIVK